ncbi:MAG TPA: hypothetical protein DDW51_20735 [Cyanobacteria bacterium UBA11367]|nr:hypothetical protein [Cyanobacteria bacterium UBA11367]
MVKIPQKIEAIINKRQTRAVEIANLIPNWESLKSTLEELESYRLELSNDSEIAGRLKEINLASILTQINCEIEVLKNLKTRLSRPTLNIGVVGGMGQGKSRLLQSLTGLDDAVIPSGKKGVCTSALSKIFHESNLEGVKGEVEFYNWPSFRDEVIDLYYKHLDLGAKPDKPDIFKTKAFPGLPENKKDENYRYLYGRLRREYYNNFGSYSSLLDGSIRQLTQLEEIRKYVTQDNRDNNENRLSYNDLAVKDVRVFCQFVYQDVGKIGLVDLPGLGDDSILDVERLIKALKQDVDFVLFVRKPDITAYRGWEESDRKMFQTAREALGDFPLSKCSFMVLNKIKTGNYEQERQILEFCNYFKRDLKEHLEVANCAIADCTDASEVRTEILIPVLNHLTNQIDLFYEEYWRSCKNRLVKLQREIGNQLEKAHNALEGIGQKKDLGFDLWFDNELWPKLTNGLQRKLRELREKRNTKDTEFEAEVKAAVANCRSDAVIPSIDEIEMRSGEADSYKIAYYIYIKEIREKLSNYFKSLGRALQKLLEGVQSSVAEVLVKEANLGELTDKQEADFFQEIVKQLPDELDKLKQGFRDIQKLRGSYEDIIINWIRLHLEELAPDENLDPISQHQIPQSLDLTPPKPEPNPRLRSQIEQIMGTPISQAQMQEIVKLVVEPQSSFYDDMNTSGNMVLLPNNSRSEAIRSALDSLRHKVVAKCENTLSTQLSGPNELAHTMVREFVDRVLSAQGVQTQWRIFLRKEQDKVWPGFKQQKDYATVQQRWQQLANLAVDANKPDALRLL